MASWHDPSGNPVSFEVWMKINQVDSSAKPRRFWLKHDEYLGAAHCGCETCVRARPDGYGRQV